MQFIDGMLERNGARLPWQGKLHSQQVKDAFGVMHGVLTQLLNRDEHARPSMREVVNAFNDVLKGQPQSKSSCTPDATSSAHQLSSLKVCTSVKLVCVMYCCTRPGIVSSISSMESYQTIRRVLCSFGTHF